MLVLQVVPDERELDNPHGSASQGWHISQEWLEPVTERADQIIQHRDLSVLFDGFDFATGMYKVPHKLRYAFPVNSHSGLSTSDEQAVAKVYHAIDEVLVELFGFLRQSFSLSRVNDAARVRKLASSKKLTDGESQSNRLDLVPSPESRTTTGASEMPVLNLQDLLMLLRFAPTHDRALYVESVLWLIWMSHPSPDIRKLTRLSMGQAKRGNYREAIEMISHASALDPTFGEAYNKLASYHHCLQEYDECITYATKALEIVPEHVGSLSGLGLSYEHKGNSPLLFICTVLSHCCLQRLWNPHCVFHNRGCADLVPFLCCGVRDGGGGGGERAQGAARAPLCGAPAHHAGLDAFPQP